MGPTACIVSWNLPMLVLDVIKLTMSCVRAYLEVSWLLISRRTHLGLYPKPSRLGLAGGAGEIAGLTGLGGCQYLSSSKVHLCTYPKLTLMLCRVSDPASLGRV
jgi:hypothetical protein